MLACGILLNSVKKVHLTLPKTVDYCCFRVLRELGVTYDKMVQVVTEEICACMPTMSVKNSEKRALRPAVTFFLWRLLDVKYDRNSILVIVSHDTLISICSVRLNNSVFFH